MGRDISRRTILKALGATSIAGVGASTVWTVTQRGDSGRESAPVAGTSDADLDLEPTTVTGTVVDLEGDVIPEATVEAIRAGATVLEDGRTNEDGQFSLPTDGPTWVRVTHPDSDRASAVRAVDPTAEATIRTPPADAITLRFGGDVMFGRRFYEEDDDPLRPRFRIDPDDRLTDHRRILQYTRPLLEAADVASVNLESPLTTTDWRHPEKSYTFVSHPVAARALADAGIDYAALGNNHMFDALKPGLEDTIDALEDAGVAHSGVGTSSEEAWEPAVLERDGTTIAFVSCTTVVGDQYDLDWSVDRDESSRHRFERDGETLAFDGSNGAAEASEDRLSEYVGRANDEADLVVTQIHGGDEYQREPTDRLRRLTETAARAGSDLVINHHPHVTGGLEFVDGALVAWSLGNLVFDQGLWVTLQSYVLTVDATADGVLSARIDPLLLEGYVPKGVTGQPSRSIQWLTAGLSDDAFTSTDAGLEYVRDATDSDSSPPMRTVSVDGERTLFARREGWISDASDAVRVGRNRLLTGEFGDWVIDEQRYEGPLWRFNRDGESRGPTIDDGDGGVRLVRTSGNLDRAVLSPRHRLPLTERSLTLVGRYRFDGESGLELRVSWYDDTSGGSFDHRSIALLGTDGDWTWKRVELDPPADATHVDVFILLSPPFTGTHEAAVDELRLLEWADEPVGGRGYDHLEIDGDATLEVAPSPNDGNFRWVDLEDDPLEER